jgi:hypothetical protein
LQLQNEKYKNQIISIETENNTSTTSVQTEILQLKAIHTKQITVLQTNLQKQMDKNDAIMEEGVQWSKDAGKQSTIIRKLRIELSNYENEGKYSKRRRASIAYMEAP